MKYARGVPCQLCWLAAAAMVFAAGAAMPNSAESKPKRPAKSAPPPVPPVNDGASKIGVVDEWPSASPDWLIREAFKCALDYPDEAAGFACYAALNVEINRDTANALQHLRLYQWKYFRQRAASYVVQAEPFSIKVTRRDPKKITGSSRYSKVFVFSRHRDNPAPIILRRDEGIWRVYANSL